HRAGGCTGDRRGASRGTPGRTIQGASRGSRNGDCGRIGLGGSWFSITGRRRYGEVRRRHRALAPACGAGTIERSADSRRRCAENFLPVVPPFGEEIRTVKKLPLSEPSCNQHSESRHNGEWIVLKAES